MAVVSIIVTPSDHLKLRPLVPHPQETGVSVGGALFAAAQKKELPGEFGVGAEAYVDHPALTPRPGQL